MAQVNASSCRKGILAFPSVMSLCAVGVIVLLCNSSPGTVLMRAYRPLIIDIVLDCISFWRP